MGLFDVKGGAASVRVEGDNWLVALGASLPYFGLDSSSLSRLSVDVAPSGVVSVRDPVSGRSFVLEPVVEELPPTTAQVHIALDPTRGPAVIPEGAAPQPVLPPMSFGVPLPGPDPAPPHPAPDEPAVDEPAPDDAPEPVGDTSAPFFIVPEELQELPEEPVVEEEEEEEDTTSRYSYNSIGKRDPFRSFIQKEVVVVGEGGPLGPLQLHEIDAYRLRGIVWNVQAPRALVEAPDGIGHVVELGTLIGKNWGKGTQIKPEEIIITEEYRDPIENELIINEITMRLPDPAEEKRN